jgi:hypothetical protein
MSRAARIGPWLPFDPLAVSLRLVADPSTTLWAASKMACKEDVLVLFDCCGQGCCH